MRGSNVAILSAMFAAIALGAWSAAAQPPPTPTQRDSLTDALRDYRRWSRVPDLRWAPLDCRLPPIRLRRSEAGPHARKVFFLYTTDLRHYDAITEQGSRVRPRVGLTLVKESFRPRAVQTPTRHSLRSPGGPIEAGEPQGLFIMHFAGEAVANTDAGWVYATATPGRQLLDQGALPRCMRCHQRAPHQRLYGVRR